MQVFEKKTAKKFGGFKKSPYLCIAFEKYFSFGRLAQLV